jgi:hypothetical protein
MHDDDEKLELRDVTQGSTRLDNGQQLMTKANEGGDNGWRQRQRSTTDDEGKRGRRYSTAAQDMYL